MTKGEGLMKNLVVRFERIENPVSTCLHCCEGLVTQRVVYGEVSHMCCDDEDCMRSASDQVQISYHSYPSDFRTPHGFHIINPKKEASAEA